MAIPLIPEIPEELIIAARTGTLVPFIGSGVSTLAGCPNWDEFSNAVLKFFVEKRKINLSQFIQLKHLSPRIKLSIAKSLQKQHDIEIEFENILHPKNNTLNSIGEEIYGDLLALSKTFITTNYDNWLDKERPMTEFSIAEEITENENNITALKRIFYKVEDFTFDNLEPDTVIHLHGSLIDPKSMILTTEDYTRHYANDRKRFENPVLTFLENLFNSRNVLFIGYGLEELEILEYIIQKAGKSKNTRTKKHFILQGFFSHEQILVEAMKEYYWQECGVQLLPFSRDECDWKQLLQVIKEFTKKIPIAPTFLVQQFKDMEDLLNSDSEINKASFIKKMIKSKELTETGFELILKEENFADYFDSLRKAGLFDASQNTSPIPDKKEGSFIIPFWEALQYLKKVSEWAGKHNDKHMANKVLEVVRTVSNERIHGRPKDNYHTWYVFTEILAALPTETIKLTDIDFLPIWLNSDFDHGSVGYVIINQLLLKWLSSNKLKDLKKVCRVFRHSLAVKWKTKNGIDTDYKEPTSVLGNHWLKELLKKNIEALEQKCSKKAAEIFLGKLQEVYSEIEKRLPSWSVRPAIENHVQNYQWNEVENCLVEGLRNTLQAWIKKDHEQTKLFINNKLLNGNLEIERRIAIYMINVSFEHLKELLPQAIPLLSNSGHLHEMYELLESHFTDFSNSEKEKIFRAIQNLPKPAREDGSIICQHTQRNWLSAIKGKGFSKADELFNNLNTNPELGAISPHPNFMTWMETSWGSGPSPYSVSKLIAFLDNDTLVNELNNFQDKGKGWLDTPTTAALVNTLEVAVTQEPLKFMRTLPSFLNAERPYQYGIVNGFKKLWEDTNNNQLENKWEETWEKLLNFFENLLSNQAFWEEPVDEQKDLTPTKAWIPPVIADFLRAGVKKDEKHLPYNLLSKTQKLIVYLLEHLPSRWQPSDSDAMNQAINTEKGKAIQALGEYTLFISRQSDKKNNEHKSTWKQIEPVFGNQLSQCKNNNQEFSTLMGSYAANLEYLSHEWLENNIKLIFPVEYPDNFLCALGGLAYAPASKKLYILLRDHGIIQAALKQAFDKHNIRKMLLERIALAYIWGEEKLNSRQIQYIFQSNNENDLYTIIEFFWKVSGEKLKGNQKKCILNFWEKSVIWGNNQKVPPGKLFSIMNLLVSYLEKIENKQKKWLLVSTPYVIKVHNTDLFLKELNRLADKNPEAVKDIFIKLLETYHPYHDFGDVLRSIIIKLTDKGFRPEMLSVIEKKLRRIQGFQALYDELKPCL